MNEHRSPWRPGATTRVGSREHYGWFESTYAVIGLHPGADSDAEFLQVRVVEGGERTLFLRQRFGSLDWAEAPAAEVPVGAWSSEPLAEGVPFRREHRNPDAWLYILPEGPHGPEEDA